jgi:pimeloyl-ACP methyl ester carboxylesterase
MLSVATMLAAPAPRDGWTSRWTGVGDVRIHHRSRSAALPALPVVMVHGLAVSHRYLMPTAYPLAARHPVAVLDLPGFGLSDKPLATYDVTRHATALSAWLDILGLTRVAVLGHSFGAEVAARLAVRRPAVVAALILASPTTDPAARSRPAVIGRWLADLAVENPRQAPVLVRDVRDARPRRVWGTLGHSVRNHLEEDLRRVAAPTLVIGGSRDRVAPHGWRSHVAALTGGVEVTVPGAAHNALTTAGPAVADAVAAHLSAVGPS